MADIKVTRGRGNVWLLEAVSENGKRRMHAILTASYPIIPIDGEFVDEVIRELRHAGLIVEAPG